MATVTGTLGANCPCCCPPDGKKCFQEWIASWSCGTLSWTGPVTDNRLCLPMDTSTEWVQIAKDTSGCEYRIYVPYEPAHCCSVNGDCGVDLGDTTTPALPFGGGTPPDCCGCNNCPPACAVSPDPICCSPCPTPGTIAVTLNTVVASPICSYQTSSPFEVHIVTASALSGRTFTLNYIGGCDYDSGDIDVTAWVRVLECVGDGTGCAACTPTTDVTSSVIMRITMTSGSDPVYTFFMTTTNSNPDLDDTPQFLPVHAGSRDFTPDTCCDPFTTSTPGPDGTEDHYTIFLESVTIVPCPP